LNTKALVDYLFSIGIMKRTERSGWRTIGMREPESVAEHSFCTALIGWALARMEGADEGKVLKMCLLHDLHESRTGDLNKMNKRYVRGDEKRAFREAVGGAVAGKEMEALFSEFCKGRSIEARVARDADALDMMLEARFLVDTGNPYARDWIKSAWEKIGTKSGKRLAAEIERQDSLGWLMRLFESERRRGRKK